MAAGARVRVEVGVEVEAGLEVEAWGGGGASLSAHCHAECCGRQVDVVDFVLMRVRNKHPSGASSVRGAASSGDVGGSSGDDASFRVDIAPAAADGASMSDLEQLTYLNLTGVIKASGASRLSPSASYLPPLTFHLSLLASH